MLGALGWLVGLYTKVMLTRESLVISRELASPSWREPASKHRASRRWKIKVYGQSANPHLKTALRAFTSSLNFYLHHEDRSSLSDEAI